ncbi:MAG TPA: flavodoxin [Phycicoccus sp.]|jgi:multimeric flavodoxin WrbA|nr:flavodoxin [Phycicoccus sp.]HQH06949.1 flavodoxin [Phycicoccus sp.]HQY95710.1 flavodoxin [Phycicoccus sp.]HRA45244.1 flavodoxin [Phycicoccus sp.]
MTRLLVVHHSVSPALDELLEATLTGAHHPDIVGVEVLTRAALSATASDVLGAQGFLLLTPANLGWMSGALKHFFDTIYYPCLRETIGRPYALLVHGNNDTTGAVHSVEKIVAGLQWSATSPALEVTGPISKEHREAARDLGATLAATLSAD